MNAPAATTERFVLTMLRPLDLEANLTSREFVRFGHDELAFVETPEKATTWNDQAPALYEARILRGLYPALDVQVEGA